MNLTKARKQVSEYLKAFSSNKRLLIVGPMLKKKQKFKDPVLFIDRGAHFRHRNEGLSVGDGDSSKKPLDVVLLEKKDFSDLSFALQQIPKNFTEVHLLGFLGGRKDHEWVGIAEVVSFLKKRKSPTKISFDEKLALVNSGHWSFKINGVFSVLTFHKAKIKISGRCAYPFSGPKRFPPLSSQGLSNVGRGIVKITTSQPILLFTN